MNRHIMVLSSSTQEASASSNPSRRPVAKPSLSMTASNPRPRHANFVPNAGQWYGLAVISDGTTVTMYADKQDGNGYQSVGSALIGGANHALAQTGNNWTFGRGWYNGGFGDNIAGNLDNIRFSDTALTVDQLLPVPEPATASLVLLGGLAILARRNRKA